MIKIICVGKLKDNLKDVSEEYFRRIRNYAKIEIVEIREYKSQNLKESLKKEGERVLKKADNGFIALDEGGKQFTSEEFSRLIKNPDLTFVIGSHAGLDEGVKNKAERMLSISKMTLPHQLARVVLLEQVYRAFTILNKQPYHK